MKELKLTVRTKKVGHFIQIYVLLNVQFQGKVNCASIYKKMQHNASLLY